MKCSLIITTKNEEKSIDTLFISILKSTRLPDEIIVADAGSSDDTVLKIKKYEKQIPIQILRLPVSTNRSRGRNRAISVANHELILITDAGCRIDPHWVEEMLFGFSKAKVVAGFYRSEPQSVFEACVAPYVLVMPNRLNVDTFLPATRSMGITKQVWEENGKFNEKLRFGEDYAFARKLRDRKIPIRVQKDAIVYWRPRNSLISFARMLYEHARGDAYSGTWRGKVLTIFGRHLVFLTLLWAAQYSFILSFFWLQVFVIYIVYSISKNYAYVKRIEAIFILPLLQVASDMAVMAGTLHGFVLHYF